MKPQAERFLFLLQLAERERDLDVLNKAAVDDYIDFSGAKFDPMPYGAHKCALMGRDLSKMAQFPQCLLERHRTGIGDGLCHQGFPKWVWSYRLTIKGKNTLARNATSDI